jgi:stage II sporulation protein D
MMKRIVLIVFLLALSSFGFSAELRADHNEYVRVAIMNDVKEADVTINGKYMVLDPRKDKVLFEGRSLRLSRVKTNGAGLFVGSNFYPVKHLRLMPQKIVSISMQGQMKKYKGYMDFVVTKEGNLLVLNVLELEDYIKGVLYHELPYRWPLEVMKAQAVVSRTYALYKMAENKNSPFDVRSDIYSQVYGGKSAERFRSNIAVKRTAGQVLVYDDKILPTYFHSTCGGHTESAKELGWEDLPPLQGVPCDFCALAPHYQWERNYQAKAVQEKLNKKDYSLGPIKEIKILDRNESGRIKNLEITSRDGDKVIITGKKFRDIVGPNEIKSNKYDVIMKGYYFDLKGKGWGHGVGMCQWGAYYMARQHYHYNEILEYYYPKAEIANYHDRDYTISATGYVTDSLKAFKAKEK